MRFAIHTENKIGHSTHPSMSLNYLLMATILYAAPLVKAFGAAVSLRDSVTSLHYNIPRKREPTNAVETNYSPFNNFNRTVKSESIDFIMSEISSADVSDCVTYIA